MTDSFRLTIDGGAQLMRPDALHRVADRILEQPDGRRYVRHTMTPHVVATVDLQLRRFTMSLHGYVVRDDKDWPGWAHELRSRLGLTPAESTHPDQEHP